MATTTVNVKIYDTDWTSLLYDQNREVWTSTRVKEIVALAPWILSLSLSLWWTLLNNEATMNDIWWQWTDLVFYNTLNTLKKIITRWATISLPSWWGWWSYVPWNPSWPNMWCTYANGATDDWMMNLYNNTPRVANIRWCKVCDLPYNWVIILWADDNYSDYRATYRTDILPIAFLNTVPNDACSRYWEQAQRLWCVCGCVTRYQYVWKTSDWTIDYTAHYWFSWSAYWRSWSAATEWVIPLW